MQLVVLPTTLDHFDYWLLHDFVNRYEGAQIIRKDMIGAPPGVDSSRVLPSIEGLMRNSGVRVFVYRGHEYHAHYSFQRPLNDALTSISDEFGRGAEIFAIQREPDKLQVFFRDIKAGWLESRFVNWLRFAYPSAVVEMNNPTPTGMTSEEKYWREIHKYAMASGNKKAYLENIGKPRQTYYDAVKRYGLS